MDSLWKRAKPVVRGLAVWVMLAGVAIGQDGGGVAVQPDGPCRGSPCEYSSKGARECGVPQVSLALSQDEWPPPCGGCDPADPLRSCCPSQDELFINPPRLCWYVLSELGVMRRNPTHNIDFASVGILPTGTVSPTDVVLSTRDYNYDFTAAGRVLVGHTFNECIQLEGVYFGVTQGDNTAAVRDNTANAQGGTGNLFSPFGGFGSTPVLGLDYNNFAQIQYVSSLYGAELNLRRKMPITPPGKLTASILFGVRYTGLPESFDYYTNSDVTKAGTVVTNGSINSIHVSTTNEMVGPQIGATFEFYVDNRWWVNVDMKGAIMNNRSHQSTTYSNVDNGTTTVYSGSREENHTAFAEEISVTAVYRWTQHFTTQIGYRALWMQNLALAPDNLNTNIDILTLGPAQLNHASSTVYHGPYAGVVIGW
jgi:hypothetical protein